MPNKRSKCQALRIFRGRQVAAAAAHGATVETIPLEAARQTMGPLADALTLDQLVSAERAVRELGWKPQAPSVLEEQ